MDAKDVRIFCELAFKGIDYDSFTYRRVSPIAIGRKLGIDEKTVRLRVRKMEDNGFIKYYQAMPTLALFQLKNMNTYRLEALNIATKHRLIEHIQELPFIIALTSMMSEPKSFLILYSTILEVIDNDSESSLTLDRASYLSA